MVDSHDINALNALRFVAEKEKMEIEAYLVSEKVFNEITSFYSGPSEVIKKAVKSFKEDVAFDSEAEEKKEEKKKEILKDAPVAKLVQVIISHALEGRASDIHIEPMEGNYRVRFRVDGILHISLILPKEIGPAVISRIKILANLKIDEKRKPQDGRFRMIMGKRGIDFRVSTLPVIEGEKIVMRILDKDAGVVSEEQLGLSGTALTNVNRAIQETYGMVLITGPTGSGKSTTLYALLKILNNEERNIITLEDPIEYYIEGLNQSQIKPEIGYTFASGLRSILRQDPNVIMVGEIRDAETAELAVHAALTGHLMFSTLHTNTAIGAIPRLIDMGIEPFLLSSSLRMVIAQRLVRKICEGCKEKEEIPESIKQKILEQIKDIPEKELKEYGVDLSKGMNFYHGKGCDKCNGTGLTGRLAIFEAVPVNDKIKDIIVEHKGSEDLITKEREAMKLLTIKQDGILKILKGITTIEEVERVTEGSITLLEQND
jgi:type IV pilus assembly protein PilB